MSREWHRAEAKRYQKELDAMSPLAFAEQGIVHVMTAYVVLITLTLVLGGASLYIGADRTPTSIFALMVFAWLCFPCIAFGHYQLAQTVCQEKEKLWSFNMNISKEQVKKMHVILERALLEFPERFDIVSVEKHITTSLSVTHVFDELKFENMDQTMGRIKVFFAAAPCGKRKVIKALDIRGVPVNIFYSNTEVMEDNTGVLFDQMIDATNGLFGFTE